MKLMSPTKSPIPKGMGRPMIQNPNVNMTQFDKATSA